MSGRALVTGGFGFVGSKLSALLVERGYEVAVLDDLSVGSRANIAETFADRVPTLLADIRDLREVQRHVADFRPSVVFHLAAVHFIPTCETHPTLAVGVNVAGTQAILEACAHNDSVEAFVLASSGAIYAPDEHPHAETATVGPTDVYGYSKAWAEELATYFHQSTGTPVGIARIFNVVGPGETNPHLLPAIIEQIRNGGELRLGNLSTRRDYVFTADVARGLALLGERCAEHGTLTCNLGSESAVSGAELVELVARAAGREVAVTSDPARFRESDRPVLLSDCRVARETLGWRAETPLANAVDAALAQPFAAGYVPGWEGSPDDRTSR
jgi:UDP-glucose 4-epimerase